MSKPRLIEQIPPHQRMTPEEVLAVAARDSWSGVIVCGYHVKDGDFKALSSNMCKEDALWIAEHLKMHTLDKL